MDIERQENDRECKDKTSFAHTDSENNLTKCSKSDNAMSNDNKVESDSYTGQGVPNEVYYSPYTGDSNAQMNHVLRSINCSVQKSIDMNGSDLPLSDPFTLRFFYNLGLEYFRGGANWNYLTNAQPPNFGQWYQGAPLNEQEITNITGMVQDCNLKQQKKGYNNDRKEIGIQSICQENGDEFVNDVKDTRTQMAQIPKGENVKDVSIPYREKMKDQESMNKNSHHPSRNGSGSRFKKNSGNLQRSVSNFSNQYGTNGSNYKASKFEKSVKGSGVSMQHSQSIPHQVHTPVGAINTYQTSYMQQGMYSGLPYYANEAETFTNSYYPPSPGFIPIQCLPPSDMADNNNMQPFPPHVYPGLDYTQTYSGLCPPYMCPSSLMFNIPSQNIPEHWYAVAGQPHYMPYTPVLPVAADTTCNGTTHSINQNGSS